MSRFKVPHTLVLLFSMVCIAYLMTLIVPQGEFDRETNDKGREQVVAGSYHEVDEQLLGPWTVLTFIPKGFEGAAHIIFFVFLIGGALALFRETGAADAAIGFLIRKMGDTPVWLVVGGILLFSIGSSTIGMAEEYLPFVPLILALCIGLGFDSVTAIGIMCIGYGIGYGVAAVNPFTLLIAQGIAEVPPTSGMAYRLGLMVVFLAVGIHHVWKYAKKIKADPTKSLVHGLEQDAGPDEQQPSALTAPHIAAIAVFGIGLVVIVYGIRKYEWYLDELAAIFLFMAIVWALIGRIHWDRGAHVFCRGAAELTTTALLIGIARTIEYMLNQGHVVDTIIQAIAEPLSTLGPSLAAVGMFFFQSICNFFIPSGSGQAYVTMPVMAPLADLVGVSRQTAVLAYQFGDGFTNILVPTNAVLVGILGLARIPYDRWFRFVFPFMIKIWILGSIAMVVAVLIGY